jgi:hypothetical protein
MLKISVLTNLRGHYEALAILQRIAAEVRRVAGDRREETTAGYATVNQVLVFVCLVTFR